MSRPAAALAVGVLVAACGGSTAPAPRPAKRIALTSPAFAAGQPIPRQYTCDGRDISPPLSWSGVPANATQLSLTMIDRDAPGGSFHHWTVRLPASIHQLGAGEVPAGASQGRNDFGKVGYGGPCPPAGPGHRYVITLTASARGSVLASGTLTGTYARR